MEICQICTKEVEEDHKALECDKCKEWYHINCVGIPVPLYKFIGKTESNFRWFCKDCDKYVELYLKNSSRPSTEVSTQTDLEINDTMQKHISKDHPRFDTVHSMIDLKGKGEWIRPRKTLKPRGVNFHNLVNLCNNFDPLNDEIDNKIKLTDYPSSVKIVGDSQVRGLSNHLPRNSLVYCYPGATVDRIDHNIRQIKINSNDHIISHVGGNDVENCRSEELMSKYESLLNYLRLQRLGRDISSSITGIIPRLNQSSYWYSKAIGINSRLLNLCKTINVNFIDLWDEFYGKKELFNSDGIHLNIRGKNLLANQINSRCKLSTVNED